jgi:hypothetical protein
MVETSEVSLKLAGLSFEFDPLFPLRLAQFLFLKRFITPSNWNISLISLLKPNLDANFKLDNAK